MEETWRKTLGWAVVSTTRLINRLACNGIIMLQPFRYKAVEEYTNTDAFPDTDRRHHKRLHSDKDVFVWKEGVSNGPARLVDISLTGMYLETDQSVQEGQEVVISLHRRRPLMYLPIYGRVVRTAAHGMALKFV